MKILSFNCRGLAGPLKKSAFKRVVALGHPDVILLQETLGIGEVVKDRLASWLPGWDFVTMDVRGHSGGLAVGWNTLSISLTNAWGLNSVLGVDLKSVELGFSVTVFNVYGPYLNRVPFWDGLFQHSFMNRESVIIGGDLNFSLGHSEIWGPHAQEDSLAGYFTQKLVENNLLDIEPIKLKPTWRNNRGGDRRVAKRIDRFLVSEQLVERMLLVQQWVDSGGASDHFPIYIEIRKGPQNPPSSVKFNKIWLQDPSFKELVSSNWVPSQENINGTAAFHFADNIRRLKGLIKDWAADKRRREDLELKAIEHDLMIIYEGEGGGLISEASKADLVLLEGRRNSLLLAKEETWRLKSRAIWLMSGDDNSKFFHAYVKGRKSANTIWSLRDDAGLEHTSFEDKARCGVAHFENLFKAPNHASIAEVIRMAQMFPRFVDEEGNRFLMRETSEEELKAVLQSFQKDKSPGPDGWTI